MANLFAITLAEHKQVFQPGEIISGALLLNTDQALTLRGVRIELNGLGHVRIRSGKVTYEKKMTYLAEQAILLGRGPFQGGSDSTLQPGNYSFPFQFSLPPHSLPTSFEGVYGNIRYWLHAVVDRPWRKNLQVDSPIFIVERVQIRDATLLQPSVKNEDRTLGLVCCPAGQLFARARIERSAFCPGEKILITGRISNQSSKQVTGTEVQLVQKTIYKAPQDTTRKETDKLYVVKNEQGFAPGEEGDVQFDSFTIPSAQPTTQGFDCIDILYEIRFIVRVAKAFNSDITFPVVMTSEPPCVRPSIDPVLSQHIYRALADYLVARASADLANNETGEEETEAEIGEDASNHTGAQIDSGSGKPYRYSRMV